MADPIFTLSSTNPFGLSNVGGDASPTFVDIDGDSDWDVFIGNDAGNVLFFRDFGNLKEMLFVLQVGRLWCEVFFLDFLFSSYQLGLELLCFRTLL